MQYFTHRFSNTTSLAILLVLSVGTAWMFSFAVRVNSEVKAILDESARSTELSQTENAFSTTQNGY